MNIIDTHCHIDLAIFDKDRDVIIKSCKEKGINSIIVPAIESKTWTILLDIVAANKGLHPALGLHPVFINSHCLNDITLLQEYVCKYKPIAIGEIGLDFYIKDTDKEKQKLFFNEQLNIAKSHDLPVILHVRKAHDDVLSILKTKNLKGGSCHAFNGSYEQAKRYIDLGFKLGFGGTMTYPNARKIHDLAKKIPLESILLETDSPDMSGFNHQGERNQPDFIVDALNALSQLKNLSLDKVADQTSKNANTIFALN